MDIRWMWRCAEQEVIVLRSTMYTYMIGSFFSLVMSTIRHRLKLDLYVCAHAALVQRSCLRLSSDGSKISACQQGALFLSDLIILLV